MVNKWEIELYTSPEGDKPVQSFIESLELIGQAKVYNAIELLKEFGTQVGSHYVKKLTGTSFWEFRILGKDSIRIFYVAVEPKTFLIVHGFKKKKQKTPRKEINIAENRLNEYKLRKKKIVI